MRGSTLTFLPGLAAAALVLAPALAQAAPTRQACVSAYEETQVSMRRSRLLASRASLQTCLDEACPSVLRSDCAGWLKEVESRTPSVVVECIADGAIVRDARIFVDGAPQDAGAEGRAIDLDPGNHTFRVERGGPGSTPVSIDVLVREGEKLKVVKIELPGTREKASSPTASDKDPGKPLGDQQMRRPVPWPVYLGLGVGVLAAGGFTVFALEGAAGKGDLEPCKPDCTETQISDVRKQFIIADVMLGLSVIALGTAGYLFFTRPSVPANGRASSRAAPAAALRFLSTGALVF